MYCGNFKRVARALTLFLLIIYVFTQGAAISAEAYYAENESIYALSPAEEATVKMTVAKENGREVRISSRLYELFFGKQGKSKDIIYLIPSGDVFGIKLKESYVTVSGAGEGSPFRKGDKIISVNGREILSADDISEAISLTKGGSVTVCVIRGGEKITLTVVPECENGKYKLGLTLREFACGIGTLTFIDPETGAFGGLGHGVCDSESGAPVEMKSGEVCGVILGAVKRGEAGNPGELSGVLNKKHLGEIKRNTTSGVFGVLESAEGRGKEIPIGYKSEVTAGEAEIISTVKNGKKASYKIEIYEIDKTSTGSKSFKIRVTDPTLIALTGGIVRGMSGSPIIQNGMLIGAVTHVMVANPTEGYGIFIENMLSAAQSQVQPKAA